MRDMTYIMDDFLLCTLFFFLEEEKKLVFNSGDWEDFCTPAEKERWWKHKFNSKKVYHDTFHHTYEIEGDHICVPAPMEQQPYWEYLNCEEFTLMRMTAHSLNPDDVRTHSCLTQLSVPATHYDAEFVENSEGTEYRAEVMMGHKFYQNRLMSWLKPTKSDRILQKYWKSDRTGTPPKEWHDAYYVSENLCPFDDGDYMSDGEYWTGGDEDTLYMRKISEPWKTFYPDGTEVDGW